MPLLGNCCFFLDLKVGTMIIGVICLISAICNTLSWAIACVMISFIHGTTSLAEDLVKIQGDMAKSHDFGTDDEYTDVQDVKAANPEAAGVVLEYVNTHLNMVKILAFFLLAYSLCLVVVASMLIHGVKKNRRGLLFPWMVMEGVKAVFLLIGAIALFAIFGHYSIDAITYTGVSFFFAVGLEIYFILVVVSQYQALGIIRMHDEHALDMK